MSAVDERLLRQGLLIEKEQEVRRLGILIVGHRERVRNMTDPFRPVESIDTTELRVEVDALTDCTVRRDALLREIAELRAALGMPRYESR